MKYDKVRKALAEILGNKEAIFDKTILQQIKEKTGLDRKTITHRTEGGKRIPGALDVIPEWNKVGSFIEGVPDKEVYAQMNFSRSKIGGNYTLNEMLQIATDTLQGKGAGLDDWQKVAGDTPSQYAVRTAGREWVAKQGKGKITFYDKNLKEIPWGKKFSSQDTFFTYNDPRYKNKFYGLNKPSKNALKILSKKFPGYTIHDLKSQIKNLPEWKEVRDVVQAKRELLGDSGINPFTGKKRTKFKPLKGQGVGDYTEVVVGDITEAPGVGGSEKGKFKIKTRGKSGKTKEVFDPTTLEVTKKKKDGKRIK